MEINCKDVKSCTLACSAIFDATNRGDVVILCVGSWTEAILALDIVDRFLLVLLPLLVVQVVGEQLLMRWQRWVEEQLDALPHISYILGLLEEPVAGDDETLHNCSCDYHSIVHFFADAKHTSAIICANIDELMLHIFWRRIDYAGDCDVAWRKLLRQRQLKWIQFLLRLNKLNFSISLVSNFQILQYHALAR